MMRPVNRFSRISRPARPTARPPTPPMASTAGKRGGERYWTVFRRATMRQLWATGREQIRRNAGLVRASHATLPATCSRNAQQPAPASSAAKQTYRPPELTSRPSACTPNTAATTCTTQQAAQGLDWSQMLRRQAARNMHALHLCYSSPARTLLDRLAHLLQPEHPAASKHHFAGHAPAHTAQPSPASERSSACPPPPGGAAVSHRPSAPAAMLTPG